jgi:uncharacterized protein
MGVREMIKEKDKKEIPYTITLIITEKCNLNCIYCFEHSKSTREMSFETAKEALDQLLSINNGFGWVNIEFTGGEPLLNFNLIKQVFLYVKSFYMKQGRKITFSIGTNGTILTDEMMTWFKLFPCISIGLSLDGTKEVHDINRSNSYDTIIKNIDFFKTYNAPVKMTISPFTIRHLSESIIHIHELGFDVEANVVFEDIWGGPQEKAHLLEVYARELEKLVNYYDTHRDRKLPILIEGGLEVLLTPWEEDYRFCGSGECMVAVDSEGKMYPCHRFASIACTRPAENVDIKFSGIKPEKCSNCKLRRMCHSCLGYNFEKFGDIDHRTAYHCEFVKLQLKAAALFRLKTIKRVLDHEIYLTPGELNAQSDAVLFLERNVQSVQDICKNPLLQ